MRPVTISQADIRRQAHAIASCVEVAHPGALARLGDDALAELAAWAEVQVKWVPDQDVGEGCSVAGSYNSDIRPPALCIALSASPGRRQFTALHEVGHHVQQNNAELGAVVIMSADSEALEEDACNLFAGQTLLPEDVVDQYVGARGPSAAEVADLFVASQASRAACCVRAAERLRSPGAVVLLDYDGVVSFAQPAGGFIPPARGSDQSGTPLVSTALRRDGRAQTETFVRYRTGGRSVTVYGDCADVDGWLVAVLAADRAPWLKFSLPQPWTGSSGARWWTCESCGEQFPVDDRCSSCGQPKCPQAGHCGCSLTHEKCCTSCFMMRHTSQFEAGGTVCRECRE
jgi:hypothetical protein